jgi:hypothetical protein
MRGALAPLRLRPQRAAPAHAAACRATAAPHARRAAVASCGRLQPALVGCRHALAGAPLLPARPPAAAAAAQLSPCRRRQRGAGVVTRAGSVADLGMDTLTFLAAVVLVVPLFKSVKASPVLGFLMAGARRARGAASPAGLRARQCRRVRCVANPFLC